MKYFVIAIINFLLFSLGSSRASNNKGLGSMLLNIEHQIYLAQEESTRNHLEYEKIWLLLSHKKFETLDFELNRIESNNGFGPLYSFEYSKLMQLLFIEKQYHLVSKLYSVKKHELSTEVEQVQLYYYLCSLLACEEYETIYHQIDSISRTKNEGDGSALDSISIYEDKSFKALKVMQAILPGSGVLVLGNYKKGIINFAMTAAFGWLGVHYFTLGYILPGAVYGVFPFSKFYFGSQRHFSYLIEQKNASNKKKCITKNEAYFYRFCASLKN
jgi:hypothetical protein